MKLNRIYVGTFSGFGQQAAQDCNLDIDEEGSVITPVLCLRTICWTGVQAERGHLTMPRRQRLEFGVRETANVFGEGNQTRRSCTREVPKCLCVSLLWILGRVLGYPWLGKTVEGLSGGCHRVGSGTNTRSMWLGDVKTLSQPQLRDLPGIWMKC